MLGAYDDDADDDNNNALLDVDKFMRRSLLSSSQECKTPFQKIVILKCFVHVFCPCIYLQ